MSSMGRLLGRLSIFEMAVLWRRKIADRDNVLPKIGSMRRERAIFGVAIVVAFTPTADAQDSWTEESAWAAITSYSETTELEKLFVSDAVDSEWAAATERRITSALSDLDIEFRQLEVVCKTSICKVTLEFRFGSYVGPTAQQAHRDASRRIMDAELTASTDIDSRRLDRFSGDIGPVSTHYLYSSDMEPMPPEVAAAMQALRALQQQRSISTE